MRRRRHAGALSGVGIVLGLVVGLSTASAARALVTLSVSGPRGDEAGNRLASALAAHGVGVAAGARPIGKGAGAPARVRGAIAQVRGIWALRLSVRDPAGQSLGGRSFPLRGPRLDSETAQQAARMVARLVGPRHAPAVRRHRHRRPRARPKEPPHVNFEQRGDQVVVPVTLRGPSGEVTVSMRWQEKAPFSTVTRQTLERLGLSASLATLPFKTGKGQMVRAPITLLDGVQIGNIQLRRGLTVGVCDACAAAGIEGQLGNNVIRNFSVKLESERGRILLPFRQLKDPATYDVSPFLQLLSIHTTTQADKLVTSFVLKNRSGRAARNVVLAIQVPGLDKDPTTTISELSPGAEYTAHVVSRLPPPGAGGTPRLRLQRAEWKPRTAHDGDGGGKGPRLAPTASPIYVDRAGRQEGDLPQEKDDLGFIVADPNQ